MYSLSEQQFDCFVFRYLLIRLQYQIYLFPVNALFAQSCLALTLLFRRFLLFLLLLTITLAEDIKIHL